MSQARPVPRCTLDDYDAIDRGERGERFEFVAGEIFAMVGGTVRHNLIVSNIHLAVVNAVRPPCQVFREGLRLHVCTADDEAKFYPDVFVTCEALAPQATEATDATLVVEVSSDSTRAYDRATKRQWYAQLPSLQDYVIVESLEPSVVIFSQPDWTVSNPFTERSDAVPLGSIDLDLRLSDIYAGIDFSK